MVNCVPCQSFSSFFRVKRRRSPKQDVDLENFQFKKNVEFDFAECQRLRALVSVLTEFAVEESAKTEGEGSGLFRLSGNQEKVKVIYKKLSEVKDFDEAVGVIKDLQGDKLTSDSANTVLSAFKKQMMSQKEELFSLSLATATPESPVDVLGLFAASAESFIKDPELKMQLMMFLTEYFNLLNILLRSDRFLLEGADLAKMGGAPFLSSVQGMAMVKTLAMLVQDSNFSKAIEVGGTLLKEFGDRQDEFMSRFGLHENESVVDVSDLLVTEDKAIRRLNSVDSEKSLREFRQSSSHNSVRNGTVFSHRNSSMQYTSKQGSSKRSEVPFLEVELISERKDTVGPSVRSFDSEVSELDAADRKGGQYLFRNGIFEELAQG